MEGYSGAPLVKKLGIKSGINVKFVNDPWQFKRTLDLPPKATINQTSRKPLDFVLLFVKSEKELAKAFLQLTTKLKPSGMLWVAWPKKSSGVFTDLTFNNVQAIGLAAGLVDVKICAVDDIW